MSKRQKLKNRAERRRAERTELNAEARAGAATEAEEVEERRPRKQARHCRIVDLLHNRGSLTDEQHRAACRFEQDFTASGSLLGHLTSLYDHKPRARKRRGLVQPPDSESAIAARQRFERAMTALGPLGDVMIATIMYDENPGGWAEMNGLRGPDGLGGLRLGLNALVMHYGGRRPAPMRVAPPVVPGDLAPPSPEQPVEVSGAAAVAEVVRLGGAASDQLLAAALAFIGAERWLEGGENRDLALTVARLGSARWTGERVAVLLNPPKPPVKPKLLVKDWSKSGNQAESSPNRPDSA